MPMTVVVTRDVEARYRGFLTSIMLEIAPGFMLRPTCPPLCANGCGPCCRRGGARFAEERS